jgi:hypothetical protein
VVDDASSSSTAQIALQPKIQSVVDSFSGLFADPTGLPPSRPCNHSIPLIPSAQLVFTKPYHYPLALKDEIEGQVGDMLAQGIIQPSASPFSSLVLLVMKKRWILSFLC